MKFNILFLLCIITLFTSCNGQSTNAKTNKYQFKEIFTKGDTVKELGNNIMVVYQDKKNIYWFGSWETGVYKYDEKTLINYTTKHGLPNNRVDEIKEDQSGNIYFTSCHPNSTITKFDGHRFTVLSAIASNDWKLQSHDLWFNPDFAVDCKICPKG